MVSVPIESGRADLLVCTWLAQPRFSRLIPHEKSKQPVEPTHEVRAQFSVYLTPQKPDGPGAVHSRLRVIGVGAGNYCGTITSVWDHFVMLRRWVERERKTPAVGPEIYSAMKDLLNSQWKQATLLDVFFFPIYAAEGTISEQAFVVHTLEQGFRVCRPAMRTNAEKRIAAKTTKYKNLLSIDGSH